MTATKREARKGERKSRVAEDTPLLEWITSGLGLLCVLFTLGFLVVQVIHGDDSPPAVTVRVETVAAVEGGYRVQFRATNVGGSAAAGVKVEGELRRGDEPVETSEVTLDYVPSHSDREGGLFFREDPARLSLVVRATGYQRP